MNKWKEPGDGEYTRHLDDGSVVKVFEQMPFWRAVIDDRMVDDIFFDALEAVGDPTDHDAIGKAMGATKRPIVAGNLEFDQATHVARYGDDFVPVTFFQIQDGKGVMISPDKFKSGAFVTPSWMTK